jgi:hypothetical protein
MSTAKSVQSVGYGLGFWFWWVIVTPLSFLVSLYWIEVGERPDLGIVQGAIGGAVIGVMQGFILKQALSRSWHWMLVTTIAWSLIGWSNIGAIGWVVPQNLHHIPPRLLWGAVEGVKVGLILGWFQGLALKQQSAQLVQWILINMVGWAIALSLGWSVGIVLRNMTGFFVGEVMGLLCSWMLVGIVTGTALVHILRTSQLMQVK